MIFLILSFSFSIPIAIWIFKNYKCNKFIYKNKNILQYFFIHCLFLIFATTLQMNYQMNYHINYLGIISYISTSCFVLFCICEDLFTSEDKKRLINIITKFKFNNV